MQTCGQHWNISPIQHFYSAKLKRLQTQVFWACWTAPPRCFLSSQREKPVGLGPHVLMSSACILSLPTSLYAYMTFYLKRPFGGDVYARTSIPPFMIASLVLFAPSLSRSLTHTHTNHHLKPETLRPHRQQASSYAGSSCSLQWNHPKVGWSCSRTPGSASQSCQATCDGDVSHTSHNLEKIENHGTTYLKS